MQHSLDGNAIGCAAPVASDDSVFKKVAWRVVPFLFRKCNGYDVRNAYRDL
ncbi:hypothetical protein [Paraburkholderia sp. 32]|uniref:hypothetical protein n=1 Tax=Paraburkholderia sp. 32 TaxID=2991057 RepID=UPI003D19295E